MQYIVKFFQVIIIDVLLSGDNAVVIALACRGLPRHLVNRAIWGGMAGAVGLRLGLIFFATSLLAVPFVRGLAGAMLLWIGFKLLAPGDDGDPSVPAKSRFLAAMLTIIYADAAMSIDNVVAVAGAVDGRPMPAFLGILISVPCVVWGSKILVGYVSRYPWIVWVGAGMLGWIAGGLLWQEVGIPSDSAIHLAQKYIVCLCCAAMVVGMGHLRRVEEETV